MRFLSLSIFILLSMRCFSQDAGSTCEAAIAIDIESYDFAKNEKGKSVWLKFTASERRFSMSVPAGCSFILFAKNDSPCGSSAPLKVIAKRGFGANEAGAKIATITEEEWKGKCGCNTCMPDIYNREIFLEKNAVYYMLVRGMRDVKARFIAVPENIYTGETSSPGSDSLQQKLADLEVGEKLTMKNIFFVPGTHELMPGAQKDLDDLLLFLKKYTTVTIHIEGHVHGSPSAKVAEDVLSTARAKVVYDFLTGNGISKERLSFKGYGNSQMIYMGNDLSEQQRNRRVEIRIMSK